MKVAGKIIVVTGAGSGMGREVTLEALRRGASVAAVDLNEATLAETASLVGAPDRISTHVLNVADRAAPTTSAAAATTSRVLGSLLLRFRFEATRRATTLSG